MKLTGLFMSQVAVSEQLHVSFTRCDHCQTCFITLSTKNYYTVVLQNATY